MRLIADAGDPLVEIFVIDPELARVARGSGRLEVDLPAGIYKVKFKTGTLGGTLEEETVVVLEAGRPTPVVEPTQASSISSPAPIRRTKTTREYHRFPARDISRRHEPHKKVGSGSRLFVFVRDLEGSRQDNPLRGLTLHTIGSEEPIVDLEATGEVIRAEGSGYVPLQSEASAACTVELDPGCYRLRVSDTPLGSFESCVVTTSGWQTQIFLPRRTFLGATQEEQAWPDLQSASVLMARPDVGFEFDNPDLRLTEKARYALSERRLTLGRSAVTAMLNGKFENPMLGLYGAHLLLLAADPDIDLLTIVIDNLRRMLGDHPDLRALELWMAQRAGRGVDGFRFRTVPMVKRSWHIIREAATSSEEVVGQDSLLANISGWEMCDTMWLTWDVDALSETRGKTLEMQGETVRFLLRALAARSITRERFDRVLDRIDLAPVEREILAYLSRSIRSEDSSPREFSIEPELVSDDAIAGEVLRLPGPFDVIPQKLELEHRIRSLLESDDFAKRLGIPKSTIKLRVSSLLYSPR